MIEIVDRMPISKIKLGINQDLIELTAHRPQIKIKYPPAKISVLVDGVNEQRIYIGL